MILIPMKREVWENVLEVLKVNLAIIKSCQKILVLFPHNSKCIKISLSGDPIILSNGKKMQTKIYNTRY